MTLMYIFPYGALVHLVYDVYSARRFPPLSASLTGSEGGLSSLLPVALEFEPRLVYFMHMFFF